MPHRSVRRRVRLRSRMLPDPAVLPGVRGRRGGRQLATRGRRRNDYEGAVSTRVRPERVREKMRRGPGLIPAPAPCPPAAAPPAAPAPRTWCAARPGARRPPHRVMLDSSRSDRPHRGDRAECGEAGPRRRLPASRAGVASTSCRRRNPSPGAAIPGNTRFEDNKMPIGAAQSPPGLLGGHRAVAPRSVRWRPRKSST